MASHKASRACYVKGCRRDECRQANYRYMSRIRLDYERGQKRRRDATQTRVHVERLVASGWTQAEVARAAGLAHRTIGAIRAGVPTVSNNTARAILMVSIGPPPGDRRDVDATGTVRRIRALVAIGWPLAQLAGQFGLSKDGLRHIARSEPAQVRALTAEAVARAYRQLACTPGPSTRARTEAQRKGWHGPMAWDDIDDPAATPEVDLLAHKRGRPAEVDAKEVARLTRAGFTTAQIAERLDCHERTVTRARGRVLPEQVAA